MQTLRKNSRGADVKRWQFFLIGQGFHLGIADGDFGPRTHAATMAFQARHRLGADGVVGLKTLGQAMRLGFDPNPPKIKVTQPAASKPAAPKDLPSRGGSRGDHSHDPSWPPRPALSPLVSTSARQKIFGAYKFVSEPVAGNAENIRILGNWEDENIVRVAIPQLRVPGAPQNGVRFHRRAGRQLQNLWRDWEKRGLLDLILSWDGAFVPRFVRGSRTVLSNHAFGTAFDINAAWNALGTRPALVGEHGSVRELVPIANAHGFFWGGHFNGRADGMHFEVAEIHD